MFDMSETLELCSRDFCLIRRPRARMVNGRKRAVDPQPERLIRGSMQKPRNADMQDLPEGQRLEQVHSFYTSCELALGEPGEVFESDQLRDPVTGRTYEVFSVRDWVAEGNYRRYLVRKVGQ